ncbi:hypothetical protein FHG87_021155 [Trinorchestia longiramus]|nr:hypothetical protein FHG87_021155 [Trinorchestia longiramus]
MADSNSGKSCMKPLNERNYQTWKIHMRMCLVKDRLWDIVQGTETVSPTADEAAQRKFESRRDLALATIVLGVDQSQLYLLRDLTDPVEVWRKLQNTFRKKSWAHKFRLKKKLFNMKLENGQNLQDHLKVFVELLEELAIIGDAIVEEERVIILLSSLPDRFSTLVTAIEANEKIPAWEVVTERLLNEERRHQGGPGTSDSSEGLLEESWSSVVQLGTELLLIDLENGCALHKINLMFLERSAYTKALLSRVGMDKANSVATPVDINADLVTTSDEVEDCDKDLYQSAVDSLLC